MMPKYRGITLSVMSQWEMKQFPEFPHLDSAQFKCQDSTQSAGGSKTRRPGSASTSSTNTSKADRRSDYDPTISCYIPSIPGIRFFFKYTIEPPHPQGQLFYFKLFMNGRHISSWGVNPRINPRGQVLRGLFEPDGTWSVSENSRAMLRQSGIESRPFLFTPEVGGRSAADDGGLIEVRIFRAKGRKRRAPSLEAFRQQEHYGINLPSAGLLDKPQDTRYYDYILVDPKDEPYAAFHFHYRSWEFLQSLQLIPSSHPRALLKPSNSFAFLAGPSISEGFQEDDDADQLDSNDEDDSWVSLEESPRPAAHISQLRSSKVLAVGHDRPRHIGRHGEAFKSSSLSLEQRNTQGIPISAFSVPQATLDEWAYDRPLPRLPKAKSSFDHSRNSSTSSNAPSITPSLLPWLDRDSNNSSPEPIIGIAVTAHVLGSSTPPDGSVTDRSSHSSIDWSLATPSHRTQPPRPMSNPFVIPPEALFPPPSITVRKSGKVTSSFISAQGDLVIEDSDSEKNDPEDQAGDVSPPPLEAEWLSRQHGLSPTKRDSKHSEAVPRWSLASANTMDYSDPFVPVRGNHTAWAVNNIKHQQAGESDNEDQHGGNPLMLGAVAPRLNDQLNDGKPEWI